jgi:flagellar P-ring protein precursor FlgI
MAAMPSSPSPLRALLAAVLAVLPIVAAPVQAQERIKDLASVGGVRGNALVGYGLVVGLDGSGDRTSQAPFTVQSLRNMLNELGVAIPDNVNPQLKNVAAVAIHAELPPFAKPGQSIDVTVSSVANAVSLRGGTLLMAPLKGADGQVYAMAQGSLIVGGFGAQGRDGSRVSVNVPSVGRIPNGAMVEREVEGGFGGSGELTLNLHRADFTTVSRMVAALDARFGPGTARAVDGVTVAVRAPFDPGARIGLLAEIENVQLTPGSAPARVIVNSRTGTVVIGAEVRVMPAAIAHGSLTVTITESVDVSQPDAFSRGGSTTVTPRSDVSAGQEASRMFMFAGGTSLDEIVRAVNAVGAAPGDLVAILEALKQAGALRAELEVI